MIIIAQCTGIRQWLNTEEVVLQGKNVTIKIEGNFPASSFNFLQQYEIEIRYAIDKDRKDE